MLLKVEQYIAFTLKHMDTGCSVAVVSLKVGISGATFYMCN